MDSNHTHRVEENGQKIPNKEEFKEALSKTGNQKGMLTDDESHRSNFTIAEESS